jgi:tetratricopeptide (TPR) repeat protein
MALLPGVLFANRFEVLKLAGGGGMGTIYRARDRFTGDLVALKLVHQAGVSAPDLERFTREAELLAELQHPSIVAYRAHGQTPDGTRYLAMEWLEGEDLASRLGRGSLPVAACLRLLTQVASALAVAHRRGIIHRDLKPSNLFLPDGQIERVKVLDFGIAHRTAGSRALTRTGAVVGTPEYMAPEQARGAREITPAADIFSLGCVLYESLTGRPPFLAEHVAAVLVRILFEEPEPISVSLPDLAPAIASLLTRMLAKEPAGRYPDADALLADIEALETPSIRATAATLPTGPARSPALMDAEQGLLCVILATRREAAGGEHRTLTPEQADAQASLRSELSAALQPLGVAAEWLLDGTLIGTARGFSSALDQAAQAARAALLIKARWPEADVALGTGSGSARGLLPVGEATERAARLLRARTLPTSDTKDSGVWADDLSAQLLARRFDLRQGSAGWELRGEGAQVDETRLLLGKPTACVGREQELAALEGAMASCADESEARAVLVTAPPGVGKSRLRRELLRRISAREEAWTILEGRGELLLAGAPYGLLRSALLNLCGLSGGEPLDQQRSRLRARVDQVCDAADRTRVASFLGEIVGAPFPDGDFPVLGAARADPQIMRDQIRRAFVDWLGAECRAAPTFIGLDDVHWGDALSLGLLDEALRALAGEPLFVLALARPEVHEAFPRLFQGRKVQEIALPTLSRKACERLLRQALPRDLKPARLARLVELSAGNALYLEELARAAAEGKDAEVPETVLAMLQARIGRLPSAPRQALRAASVLGPIFWEGGVRALLAPDSGASQLEPALEHLIASELIERRPESRIAGHVEYEFRHALARDAAYALLSADERRGAHARAAEFLERSGSPDPAALADHWQKAEVPDRAIPWLLQAAHRSFIGSDLQRAGAFTERGLALGAKGHERGALRALQGATLAYSAAMGEAMAALDEALSLLPPGDPAWCLACHCRLGVTLLGCQWETTPLQEAMLAAEPAKVAVVAYVIGVGTLTTVFSWAGLKEPAQRFHARTEEAALRDEESLQVRCWRIWSRAAALDVTGGGLWEVAEAGGRARDVFLEAGDERIARFAQALSALALSEAGEVARGEAELREALAAAVRLNELLVQGWVGMLLANELAKGDRHGEATELARGAIAAGAPPAVSGVMRAALARAAVTAGRFEEAEREALEAIRELGAAPAFTARAQSARVDALLAEGKLEEAKRAAEEGLLKPPPNSSLTSVRVALRTGLARALRGLGDIEGSKASIEEALGEIRRAAGGISDPDRRAKYLQAVPENARARRLAEELLGRDPLT